MDFPELTLVPSQTALAVIDLQEGIVSQTTEPRSSAEVVANAARLAEGIRDAGGTVVWVRVAFSADRRDLLSPTLDVLPPTFGHAPDWADLVLEVHASDLTIVKRQWSAFHGTELDLQLRRRGIKTIVLCGISTNIGVESTARQAFELGYDQVFVEDAMTSTNSAAHAGTLAHILPRLGRIRTTNQVLAAL